MFGFFQFQKDLRACKQAVSELISPTLLLSRYTSKPFPNQVFGDAYVIGFIQNFLVFIMHTSRGKEIKPPEQLALVKATFDHFIPNFSKELINALTAINQPDHPMFNNYSTGKRDAKEYIEALKNQNLEAGSQKVSEFNEFIKRNYLNL